MLLLLLLDKTPGQKSWPKVLAKIPGQKSGGGLGRGGCSCRGLCCGGSLGTRGSLGVGGCYCCSWPKVLAKHLVEAIEEEVAPVVSSALVDVWELMEALEEEVAPVESSAPVEVWKLMEGFPGF